MDESRVRWSHNNEYQEDHWFSELVWALVQDQDGSARWEAQQSREKGWVLGGADQQVRAVDCFESKLVFFYLYFSNLQTLANIKIQSKLVEVTFFVQLNFYYTLTHKFLLMFNLYFLNILCKQSFMSYLNKIRDKFF